MAFTNDNQQHFSVPVERRESNVLQSRPDTNRGMQINIASEEEAAKLAAFAQANRPKDPLMGWRPTAEIVSKQEVVYRDGKLVHHSLEYKTEDAVTHHAAPQLRPGFIHIPGVGETTIAAAKAGGLIPHDWQEGQPSPFAAPAEEPQKGTKAGTPDKAEKDSPKELSVAQHQAKVASQILDAVDKAHGPALSEAMIDRAVETGELPVDMLPKGFTEVQMKQVQQGYIAQADSVLSKVGASVSLLSDMLSDEELTRARRYTIARANNDLAELGKAAVQRLAGLPQSDPEGFLQMVADMPPAERKCIVFDNKRREWTVRIPGKPVMSYGAAVNLGLVRV